MAYANTAVLTHIGGRDYKLVIQETEAGAATEATIAGLPTKGVVTAQLTTKFSGSATTVAPILVTTSASSAAVYTVIEATAAADQSNQADPPAHLQDQKERRDEEPIETLAAVAVAAAQTNIRIGFLCH